MPSGHHLGEVSEETVGEGQNVKHTLSLLVVTSLESCVCSTPCLCGVEAVGGPPGPPTLLS